VVCPRKDQFFFPTWPAFDRERRLLLLGAASLIPFMFLKGVGKKRSKFLRPPGVVDENDFLGRCARCGLCLRLCPTKALQPAFFEAGEAFGTPKLVPRSGYCLPTCNSCGQNCPTAAIPRLELAQKNKARIGIARVDPARCVGCFRCVEKCPHSALSFGQLPIVNLSRCVGCGACENLCPQEPAAIKVLP
jgi:ferredoxin